MRPLLDTLADGETERAAVVGWLLLALAAAAVLLMATIAITLGVENFFDRLARTAPPGSARRWSMLIGGAALVALGFIVQSFGLAMLGGVLLFCFWRVVERPHI